MRAFAGRKWEVVDSVNSVALESLEIAFVERMIGSEKYQLKEDDLRMISVFWRIYVAVSYDFGFLLVVVVREIRGVEEKQLDSKMSSERGFEDPF